MTLPGLELKRFSVFYTTKKSNKISFRSFNNKLEATNFYFNLLFSTSSILFIDHEKNQILAVTELKKLSEASQQLTLFEPLENAK